KNYSNLEIKKRDNTEAPKIGYDSLADSVHFIVLNYLVPQSKPLSMAAAGFQKIANNTAQGKLWNNHVATSVLHP
ncbi:Hypothetical predicted protein, partial [Paramuricea clavata]